MYTPYHETLYLEIFIITKKIVEPIRAPQRFWGKSVYPRIVKTFGSNLSEIFITSERLVIKW